MQNWLYSYIFDYTMKKVSKIYLLIIFFFFAISTITVSFSLAQEDTAETGPSIAVTPSSFRIIINPGETLAQEFRLRNSGVNPTRYSFQLADSYSTNEVGGLEFKEPDPDAPYSLATWFQFDKSEIVLEPKEAKTIKVNIKAPRDAEPGGHYGTIFVVGKPTEEEGAMIANVPRLAVNFIAVVTGEVTFAGKIVSFSTPNFAKSGPIDFLIRYENEGTVHENPKGEILVYDMFGREVDKITVKPQFAFPKTIRQLPATWERIFLIGKYTAVANISHGENYKDVSTAKLTFWAFPWTIALGIIFVIAALFALGRLSARKK